jgi:hypothetical protein
MNEKLDRLLLTLLLFFLLLAVTNCSFGLYLKSWHLDITILRVMAATAIFGDVTLAMIIANRLKPKQSCELTARLDNSTCPDAARSARRIQLSVVLAILAAWLGDILHLYALPTAWLVIMNLVFICAMGLVSSDSKSLGYKHPWLFLLGAVAVPFVTIPWYVWNRPSFIAERRLSLSPGKA